MKGIPDFYLSNNQKKRLLYIALVEINGWVVAKSRILAEYQLQFWVWSETKQEPKQIDPSGTAENHQWVLYSYGLYKKPIQYLGHS